MRSARISTRTGAEKGVGANVGAGQIDVLSRLALRERTIRLWLAALGMFGFGLAYVSPLGLALRTPQVEAKVVIPTLALPAVAFPTLAVPKLGRPRRCAASATRAAAPRQRHVVRHRFQGASAQAPHPQAGHAQDPVVHNSYSLLEPAAKPAAAEKDPFAKATVVTDTVGVAPTAATDPVATTTARSPTPSATRRRRHRPDPDDGTETDIVGGGCRR